MPTEYLVEEELRKAEMNLGPVSMGLSPSATQTYARALDQAKTASARRQPGRYENRIRPNRLSTISIATQVSLVSSSRGPAVFAFSIRFQNVAFVIKHAILDGRLTSLRAA